MHIAGAGPRCFGQHRVHDLNHRFARRERPQIVERFGQLAAKRIGGASGAHHVGRRQTRRRQDRRANVAGTVLHRANVGPEGALEGILHGRRDPAVGRDHHGTVLEVERQHRVLLQPPRRQLAGEFAGRRRPQVTGIATHAGGFRESDVPSNVPGERSSIRFFTRSRIASASASERTRYGVTKIASSVR